MTVRVVGQMPVNPNYPGSQDVICYFDLIPEGGGQESTSWETSWSNGDPPMEFHWQRSFDASFVGTASWTIRCQNYYISPTQWRYDSGTLEIT